MAKTSGVKTEEKISVTMREKLKRKPLAYLDFFIYRLSLGDDEEIAAEMADGSRFSDKEPYPNDALIDEKLAPIKTKAERLIEWAKRKKEEERQKKLDAGQLALFDVTGKGWSDAYLALPNDIVRSALFTARSKKDAREHHKQNVVYSHNNDVSILYTGEELRVDDDGIVWNEILNLAKRVPLGSPIKFTLYAFLKNIGWATNGAYYKKLRDCIFRLKANSVRFRSEKYGRDIGLSLIRSFTLPIENEGDCIIELEPKLVNLFTNNQYTRLLKNNLLQLSPMATKLYEYFSSHKQPYPLKVEAAMKICGSRVTSLRSGRMMLKRACLELKEKKCFHDIFVDSKEDVIRCFRETPTGAQEFDFEK